jgi:ribosomal protein S18 acetylase RimI-like enzyme
MAAAGSGVTDEGSREGAAKPRTAKIAVTELATADRLLALPILKESFTGIYRWHAKRSLQEVATARAARVDGALAGVALLEQLEPEVGYVYYVFVGSQHRRQGIGAALLDDALAIFRRRNSSVVYAVAESANGASIGLFRSRGFRTTERDELGWREGGLGAWGLRSRMRVVYGEVVLGLRLPPKPAWSKDPDPA